MQQQANDFLDLILPIEGIFCAVHFVPAGVDEKGRKKFLRAHEWYSTPQEVADRVLYWSGQGFDTYHACASFKTAGEKFKGRTHENVHHVASFWIDIDCGEGKPYPTKQHAGAALCAFLKATGLPVPTVVSSGNGLHVYWPIEEALTGAAWKPHALALGELAVRHGLHVDTACTSDQSRILRTPGTMNHKADPIPVEIHVMHGPFANDEILRILEPSTVKQTLGNMPAELQGVEITHVDAGKIYAGESKPAFAAQLAPVCPQMKIIRDTRGNVDYPTWLAGMTILARCVDGEKLAHEWSAGHPTYSAAETDRKLIDARAMQGPATCDHFAAINPAPCGNCPNKGRIKSPITLGVTDKLDLTSAPEVEEKGLPKMPTGYHWGHNNAVCYEETDKLSGTRVVEVLYPYPVYVEAVREGETRIKTQYILRHWTPGVSWRTFALNAMDAAGPAVLGHLADAGMKFSGNKLKRLQDYLHVSVAACVEQKRRQMSYEQFGWKADKSFVYGLRQYRPDGSVSPIGGTESVEQRGKMMEPRGTLKDWQWAAQQFFGDKMEPHAFTLLCGFAAPLMHFTETPGTIVSLVGETGGGKSQAAFGAVSIWGEKKSLVFQDGDTPSARFNSFGVINNLPIVVDDAHRINADDAKAYALNFTDGRDKLRSQQDGSVKMAMASWSTILILTGNYSMVDKIGTVEDAKRIFEFMVPTFGTHVTQEQGEAQLRALWANRGVAGEYYLSKLIANYDAVEKTVNASLRAYAGILGNRPEDRFWIRLLGCVAAASLLVTKMGILEFNPKWVMSWAVDQIMTLKINNVASADTPGSIISSYMDAHPANTLVVIGEPNAQRKYVVSKDPVGALTIRKELASDGTQLVAYFEQKAFRQWLMKNGYNPLQVREACLQDKTLLQAGHLFVMGKGTHHAGGQVKVWKVDLASPAISGIPREVSKDAAMAAC